MASCKYNPGINSVNPYAVLNVTQQSQNIETNKTTVRYELLLYRPSKISSSANKAYSVVVNDKTVKSGTTTIGGSGTKSITSGTIEIPHNSDGTKSISFSFSLTLDITWHGTWVGTGKANGSMNLATIPRATTAVLTPSDVYLGGTINIDLSSRASSNFTHNLYWKFGELTGTIGTGIATSASLKTEKSWASQIPNGSSGIGYIYCDTFNGDTKIGAKTVSFTANISTGMEPLIDSVSISEAVSGIYNQFYGYVQNKSQLLINISARGVNGATIKSYKTIVDGVTYGGQEFTTSPISKSGNVEISISVTDSRGLTTTTTRTVNVMEYSPPRISQFMVVRGNADNTPNSIGNYAVMRIDFAISKLGGRNRNSYKIEYKSNDDYDYRLLGTYSGYEFSGIKNGGNILNGSNTYAFRLTVTDFFGDVVAEYDGVPTSSMLFNVNKEGTSMCFGAVSKRTTERCYDFEYPVCIKESVLPYDGENADIGSLANPFSNGYFNNIYINGKNHGDAKVLWDNAFFMAGNPVQVATLTEAVSAQQHGIILVFSEYVNGAAANYSYQSFFVSKKEVEHRANVSHCFPLFGAEFAVASLKFLFIHDTKIVGDARNNTSGTKSGITYDGKRFVMRTVYGI